MAEKKVKTPYVVGDYTYPTPGAEKRGLLPKYKGADIGGILRAEAHKRTAAFAKGERIGSRPGRLERAVYESRPTSRVAFSDVETGRVYRGTGREIHADIWERENLMGSDYGESKSRYKSGFAVGREGKFVTKEQMKALGGADESTYIRTRELGETQDQSRAKARLRAGTIDPLEQHRRRLRAEKAKLGVKSIKSERKLLLAGNTRESPESLRRAEASRHHPGGHRVFNTQRVSRIQQLTRRLGTLKNLAKKAGVFGIVSTPFTTGEALMGVGSSDKNERLRSIETLLGLPEFSTGRGLSGNEKDTKPIWYDPTTGEGKL